MRKLTVPPYSVEYFSLCRELGADVVDAMVKSRLLELRWTRAVSDDGFNILEERGGLKLERPRVLAMTPVLRKAMEIVLREEEEGETK